MIVFVWRFRENVLERLEGGVDYGVSRLVVQEIIAAVANRSCSLEGWGMKLSIFICVIRYIEGRHTFIYFVPILISWGFPRLRFPRGVCSIGKSILTHPFILHFPPLGFDKSFD